MNFRVCFLYFAMAAASMSTLALSLDEAPVKPGEWGYRPDNDTPISLNPPAFSWRPTKEAASYVLQVASDEAFEQIVCANDAIPWSAYCPSEPLPQGTLYWRYAAKDASGTQSNWSQVRPFAIPENAVRFPKPTIEQLVERMPAEHPRLFFRAQDLPRFRELAQGAFKGRWDKLKAAADKVLAKRPDTSEPQKYPEGVTRLSDEWKKIWWGNRNRVIAVADNAALLGFVYRISGDEKYALAGRDLLLAMTKWDETGSTGYRYNDEAAMPALYMTSRAYSWIHPVLSEADIAAIAHMMRVRGKQAFDHLRRTPHLWRPFGSHSNRAWHFLGEVAIAFHGDFPEADTWLDYAMTIFYTAYPVWGDADGGWHEGAAYWSSYTYRFMYWVYVIRSAFGIDVFQRPFYHSVGDFPMYTMPPGTATGGFGDQAILTNSGRMASLMAILASGAQNGYWKWYSDACGGGLPGGYLGFIYAAGSTDLEATPPTDLPSSTVFRGVGVAVLNSNLLDGKENVQVHFKSSPMGRQSHGYNANNGFLLNLRGQRALLRSGRRDIHGSPHHREWMWHSKSDNAILVNGEGQIRHTAAAQGRITDFRTSPSVDVVAGEAADSYKNLDRWTRRIVFFKPNVILIHDILDAPEPSTFQWTLHAKGQFVLGDQEVMWEGEPGRVKVRFLEPEGLDLSQTDEYDTPPHEWARYNLGEWHLTAAANEKVQRREILTVLAIDDVDPQATLTRADDGTAKVSLTLPDGPAEVVARPDGFQVHAPGVRWSF